MKCKLIKNGQNCNANHTKGSKYCFRHDPKNKATALEVSRKGGKNRILKGSFGKKIKLNSADDVKSFLSQVINAVWTGDVPVKVGSAMGFLTPVG